MTQIQTRIVAVLSAVATLVVLVAGSQSGGLDARLATALGKARTFDVTGPASGDTVADDDSTADDVAGDAATGGGTVGEEATGGTVGGGEDPTPAGTPGADEEPAKPTKIKHVFVITLAGHGFDATFGPDSQAAYLNGELVPKGALLSAYRSLGRADLPDYIAMIGGQPPNADTEAGCPVYEEMAPTEAPSKSGEVKADGCVYPNTVATVADQMTASRRSWRAYVEDLDKGPKGAINCRRPESNAPDDTTVERPGDGYATRHNPFVYYHSLLDLGDCDASNGPLERLETDLATVAGTPNFAFVVPDLCNRGTVAPCLDGTPGGLTAADAFLATWVPKILESPAYERDGLLIITFTGNAAPESDEAQDEYGGGSRNGALLLSRFAEPGSTVASDYDPYSLLRSVQDLFALRPLARAVKASSFADTVLSKAFSPRGPTTS